MEIGDPIAATTCGFSPDGAIFHYSVGEVVYLRDISREPFPLTMKSVECRDVVESVQWRADSKVILCVVRMRDLVQIFNVDTLVEIVTLDEGSGKLKKSGWTPSGDVYTQNTIGTVITLWRPSEDGVKTKQICNPKNIKNNISFSQSGCLMSICTRINKTDSVVIVNLSSLDQKSCFPLKTIDSTSVDFLQTEQNYIVALDSMLISDVVYIYTDIGELVKSIKNTSCVAMKSSLDSSLLFSCGSSRNCITVIDGVLFSEICNIKIPDKATCFVEQQSPSPYAKVENQIVNKNYCFGKVFDINLQCCPSGLRIAFSSQLCPEYIWVVGLRTLSITAVIQQASPVRSFSWQLGTCTGIENKPSTPYLAFLSSSNSIYFWNQSTCSYAGLPSSPNCRFTPTTVKWRPVDTLSKKSLLLLHDHAASIMSVVMP